jgi:hypothetical protein
MTKDNPMTDKKPEIKDYAGGWITEKEGTEPPGFLKLAFPVIGLSSVAYIILYINGETTHAERGPLVAALNRATEGSDAFMYIVAAVALAFVAIVVLFALRKSHE